MTDPNGPRVGDLPRTRAVRSVVLGGAPAEERQRTDPLLVNSITSGVLRTANPNRELCAEVGWHRSKVSRVELGHAEISVVDVIHYLGACKTDRIVPGVSTVGAEYSRVRARNDSSRDSTNPPPRYPRWCHAPWITSSYRGGTVGTDEEFSADMNLLTEWANTKLPAVAEGFTAASSEIYGLTISPDAVFGTAVPEATALGEKYNEIIMKLAEVGAKLGASVSDSADQLNNVVSQYQLIDDAIAGK